MKIKVHLAPYGAGLDKEQSILLQCGPGTQILQWIGYAACARLANAR